MKSTKKTLYGVNIKKRLVVERNSRVYYSKLNHETNCFDKYADALGKISFVSVGAVEADIGAGGNSGAKFLTFHVFRFAHWLEDQ